MEWKLKSHNVNSTTQIQEVCTTALHCMHKDNTLAMHAEFGVIHFLLPWWCAAGREMLGDHTLEKLLQWVPLNIIPSVHEKIMTISGIFYYPMYSYYRGYRGTIGPV